MADSSNIIGTDQVAVNMQRLINLMEATVELAASEAVAWAYLQQRVANYSPTPAPTPKPTFTLSAPIRKAEGDTGTTEFRWTLTLDPDGSTANIPYSYAVEGSGSNPANALDFGGVFPSGSGTFISPETARQVVILAYADTSNEPDEQFTLTITSPGIPTVTSTGTLLNEDVVPVVPAFVMNGPATIMEGNAPVVTTAYSMTGPLTIAEGNLPASVYAMTGPANIAEGN